MTLNSAPNLPVKNNNTQAETPESKDEQDETDANKDLREKAVRVAHNVHTLLCIISNLMTNIESLQATINSFKEYSAGRPASNRPNPNRQLEELRNLQDQLSREKAEFRTTSQQERAQLDEERAELTKLRNQLIIEERDIVSQREMLYRKLEVLEKQGVSLVTPTTSGNVPIVPSSSVTSLSSESLHIARKKSQDDKSSAGIPANLFSTTNQHKVQQLPVKQQLPLKLATRSNNSNTRWGFF